MNRAIAPLVRGRLVFGAWEPANRNEAAARAQAEAEMIVTDHFVYIHVSRTGGTFLSRLILER